MIRSPSLVLIDTWWNVNVFTQKDSAKQYIVLIDTWWNVNATIINCCNIRCYRFNRYMVECEYI